MPATYLRQATNQDLPEIKKIIQEAKAYLKKQGIDQCRMATLPMRI